MAQFSRESTPGEAGPPANSQIKTVACLGGVSLERGVPSEEIHDYIQDPDNVVWMDVQDPGPAELSLLLEEFGFHPLALEDAAKEQQRPKVDEYKGYLFIVAYGALPSQAAAEVRVVEVDLFIGRNYLVTLHRGRVPALEDAMGRWTRGGVMLREGVGFLAYTVLDALIDAYFPLVDAIEEQMDEIELHLFTSFRQESIQNLLAIKRTLVALRRVLYPLREIFGVLLRREHSYFAPATLVYFQDVYHHVLRLLDVLDLERDMVSSSLEAYLTVISNRLNQTMKALTVITICVAIAGSVFGAWGMNFDPVPFGNTAWGFWAVLGGTVGLIALALTISWKRRWL